ncbi:precorrin-6y C5,15-methyltransferase (decarboxylating) subunit CbiE [Notoacmeibacter sp. MSK16QG-6]|uniref:precorrin-6y C5,15-methyltransferase (decarboxylating) subunit CbiE n=1 Tax=Notoacmeibacter sp. MSK16QG-6 TaxID=2957982 RepID=UPI0020A0FE3C|nr:precorrin-6y C5,15-methyltransferase (decarboxylating) subunit CbiE [Notoacmeibacter sp. MSK16QG-6]MCP1199791.1 precorrin-6y C5,15-methyltransferase (decarboxylating) subunit CbiE [Notoacmeibacter sp. MSK16QG-6]
MSERPWLTVVGIGEDGVSGLSPAAHEAIRCAKYIFGGTRHLALASELIEGDRRPWPSPFDTTMEAVRACAGEPTCVLASGDPLHFGVGVTLARVIEPAAMRIIAHPSAFSLAAARMGWALQEVETLSLHGEPIAKLRRHLQHKARLLLLTSNGESPAQIARFVTDLGMGESRIVVMEALGGEREKISEHSASALAQSGDRFDPLNVVALSIDAEPSSPLIPLAPGLPDDYFDHDGQITKCDIRAITLSALAPRPGETLLDIGAGSGSIAIEWMLAHPRNHAIAIEANEDRAARITENAISLGVPDLEVVQGKAPEALSGLTAPDAVFVGGGASDHGVMDAALDLLPSHGRLVANAVTLETEALFVGLQDRLGGSLTRIQISHVAPIGAMRGWRSAMPVTQWRYRKADSQ